VIKEVELMKHLNDDKDSDFLNSVVVSSIHELSIKVTSNRLRLTS